ncbi:hypothetical protein GCM10027277_27050 [Pseudoduganella ginsengisoli]|uniref:Uncharacterized protein n=1 Tax=Pseudoduganella ginsengisoli TaxID=1462440 RepID=A0A6L6Q0Y7_9BURK|nr:hypothetical protein [Pseudoduganella ginsengisoli]MTW03487.1 hypothetical protein [Pseudoduganella ginsengisoli]
MNIAKNMEAIFLAAVTLAGATLVTTAVAAVPAAKNTVATAHTVQANAAKVPVVVISAKRLSAAEKAALAN